MYCQLNLRMFLVTDGESNFAGEVGFALSGQAEDMFLSNYAFVTSFFY